MPYPVIADVTTLVRIHLDDTQNNGAGLIFTDSASFVLPLLNDACRRLQRDLEDAGVPTRTNEVFIPDLPPLATPGGVGVPDPTIQQNLSFSGFFDGQTLHATPTLPTDLLVPMRMWQRSSGTGLTMSEVTPAQAGLSSEYQDFSMGNWDWRNDAMYWNGALVAKDIRLRYKQAIANFTGSPDFATTTIPFLDSEEPLSYLMAYKFSASTSGAAAAADLLQGYERSKGKIISRYIRIQQETYYHRQAYGDSGDMFSWF